MGTSHWPRYWRMLRFWVRDSSASASWMETHLYWPDDADFGDGLGDVWSCSSGAGKIPSRAVPKIFTFKLKTGETLCSLSVSLCLSLSLDLSPPGAIISDVHSHFPSTNLINGRHALRVLFTYCQVTTAELVGMTVTGRPAKLKMFTICPFMGNICCPRGNLRAGQSWFCGRL